MENSTTILDFEDKDLGPDKHIAPTWKRFLNLILDRIILILVFLVIYRLIFEPNLLDFNLPGLALLRFTILYAIGYFVLFEYFTGTRVITKKGNKSSFFQALGRTLCRIIPFEQLSFLSSNPVG